MRTVRYVVKTRSGTDYGAFRHLRDAYLEAERLNQLRHMAKRFGPFKVDVSVEAS